MSFSIISTTPSTPIFLVANTAAGWCETVFASDKAFLNARCSPTVNGRRQLLLLLLQLRHSFLAVLVSCLATLGVVSASGGRFGVDLLRRQALIHVIKCDRTWRGWKQRTCELLASGTRGVCVRIWHIYLTRPILVLPRLTQPLREGWFPPAYETIDRWFSRAPVVMAVVHCSLSKERS
jgi:hypothetical protein